MTSSMIGGKVNSLRLYTFMITANMPYISGGCSMGWTSPILEMLINGKECIKISMEQGSWIVSCMPLGAIIGPFIVTLMLDLLGRKWTLMIAMTVHLISWAVLCLACNIAMLYSGRLLNGLTVGIVFMSVPVYISETSDERNRNKFCSLNELFIGIGYLTAYTSGSFLNYRWTTAVCMIPTIIFLVIFLWAPETPYFLVFKKKRMKAYILLTRIRVKTNEARIESELNKMEELHAEFAQTGNFCHAMKEDKYLIKELVLGMSLVCCQQMSGASPIQAYAHHIFHEVSPSIPPGLSVVAIGLVQLITSCFTPFLVTRLGVKYPLLFSCIGVSTCLSIAGTYVYLKLNQGYKNLPVWIPCSSIITFMIFYSLGLGPLPWVSMSEILAPNIKSTASAIITSYCFLLFSLTTKFYPNLLKLGGYVPFFYFSIMTIISFFFILFFLPNTRRLTLQQIQDILHGLSARSTHGFYSSLFLLSSGRLGRPPTTQITPTEPVAPQPKRRTLPATDHE